MSIPEPAHFRQVLGQYPTGVVVVTALDAEGRPLGMTVGSFTSVSLDPPLVAFLPDQSSSSWRALRESGDRFCVNVLGAHQEDVCRAIAVRKTDKFDGIGWRTSPQGNPIIDGAVAYIDCTTEQIHGAGDHHIVVGRVQHLDLVGAEEPLLFFRGGYGSFAPLSLASAGTADLLEHLRLVDLARPQMEALAARFDTEVTAIALVRDELVLAAAAGRTRLAVAPTRVGQRLPFIPPLGSCFAAWGDDRVRNAWLQEGVQHVPALVRQRGYSVALGHGTGAQLEELSTRFHQGDAGVSREELLEAIASSVSDYNPASHDGPVELRFLSAPVFDADGRVAFTLTLWGPPGEVGPDQVALRVDALLAAAAAATAGIGGVPPRADALELAVS
ncbi:flavin reductase [Nocardioides sp. Root1257]|uniref:flavin reductase n=1 Tax=unclassified Nocardioides TaxID=2615069 RepID=UPI0006FBA220|nr:MULTISPECIES: flavin reductase [unclassified Nocardioides]KQW47382.1 flavin reductase [Nocardioides sp. Root1257]KRC45538.1 flavin reductase [Nocardioides sp. Root224]